MAAAGPIPVTGVPTPLFRPIIEQDTFEFEDLANMEFDHRKHIAFTPPAKIITMEDIGFAADTGVSPVAVSEPFQLFSKEAIYKMRSEIFKAEVMTNCQFSSNLAACYLRGYSPKYAPFVYDAWKHPKTLEIVSKIAGVDLVPEMDTEIGHVNVSVKSQEQTEAERSMIDRQRRMHAEDEGVGGCPWEDDAPVVGWHNDSYPFVCVLMLSNCEEMVGGETALRTASGDVLKVRGPQMGCAVVMQGRYITHQALRALGAAERITMVTSFRPRCPFVRDDSILANVRGISNLSELYYDFSEYRMEIMEQRVRAKLKEIRDKRRAGKKFDTRAFKGFMSECTDFINHTNAEVVEEDKVVHGHLDEVSFDDENKAGH